MGVCFVTNVTATACGALAFSLGTVASVAGGRQEAATKYKNKLSRRGRILQRACLLRGLRVDQVLACADS